jgi:DnaK suppressor protein
MNAAKLKQYKKSLLDRRDELRRLIEVSKAGRDPVELDQSRVGRLSRMDALQNQAMALETERRRNVELQRIAAALKRLDTDDFGYCLSCGEVIESKRLSLDPTAPLCIDCAQSR